MTSAAPNRAVDPWRRPLLALVGGLVLTLVEIGVLDYAYERIGLGPHVLGALLAASLLGSLINLPVGELPRQRGAESQGLAARPGDPAATLLAVNVGGALVPAGLALYLAFAQSLGLHAVLATVLVALLAHRYATPVPGYGIALPIFLPPAAAAVIAALLAPGQAPALAYVAGTLGTLIGADLTNLRRVGELGSRVVSIGGAGTFDGIFLTGVLAVLLA